MILERFYDPKLAQASYLIGCSATGEALVVDPNRDVDQYVEAAEAHGVHITHISETHIHADFVSGVRELAERTGGRMYLSDEGDENWKYRYAKAADAQLVYDGDSFMVGNVKIEILHTPGHTPEHISFVITDTAATDRAMGVLTGDFTFVGDVGRPDLLERAAKVEGTMESAARVLFQSLQRFKNLPDYLQIWPGHGAGSACGKALGAVPSSTLGYERATNWAFAHTDEDEFVAAVLAGQPEPPKYFAEMKRINKEGARILGGFRRPERLPENRLGELVDGGAFVVDTRRWADFAGGHVPGTINVPLNQSFTTWAGWLVPYDRDFYLIIDDAHASHSLDEAVRDLASIGLDRVAGYFSVNAVEDWAAGDRELQIVEEVHATDLQERLAAGTAAVVDVRGRSEWEADRLPSAPNIPLGYLVDRLDELPTDKPIVLQCRTGARSAIAASLLQARGYDNVQNLLGGIEHWRALGLPVEVGEPAPVGT